VSNEKIPPDVEAFASHLLGRGPTLEIVTLKGHLWIEGQLRKMLAIRLGVPEQRLPRLSFSQLATLALCGLSVPLFERIVLINQIRNSFAHHMNPADQTDRIQRFVAIVKESPWPQKSDEQLVVYAKAISHTAGFIDGVTQTLSRHCAQF